MGFESFVEHMSFIDGWIDQHNAFFEEDWKTAIFVYFIAIELIFQLVGLTMSRNRIIQWDVTCVIIYCYVLFFCTKDYVEKFFINLPPWEESPEERMTSSYPLGFLMISIMTAYNLLAFCHQNLDQAFIIHHIAVFTMLYIGAMPYAQYYGSFALGITEISNMPLAFREICKELKIDDWRKSLIDASFILAYVVVRLVLYFWHQYYYWLDVYATHSYQWYEMAFLLVNATLAVLQVYWGYLIVRMGARKVLCPKPKKKAA